MPADTLAFPTPANEEVIATLEQAQETAGHAAETCISFAGDQLGIGIRAADIMSRLYSEGGKSSLELWSLMARRMTELGNKAIGCRTLDEVMTLPIDYVEGASEFVLTGARNYMNFCEKASTQFDPLVAQTVDLPERWFRAAVERQATYPKSLRAFA